MTIRKSDCVKMIEIISYVFQFFGIILLGLLTYDFYERFQPFYKTAKQINGEWRYPIIGNMPDILGIKTGIV